MSPPGSKAASPSFARLLILDAERDLHSLYLNAWPELGLIPIGKRVDVEPAEFLRRVATFYRQSSAMVIDPMVTIPVSSNHRSGFASRKERLMEGEAVVRKAIGASADTLPVVLTSDLDDLAELRRLLAIPGVCGVHCKVLPPTNQQDPLDQCANVVRRVLADPWRCRRSQVLHQYLRRLVDTAPRLEPSIVRGPLCLERVASILRCETCTTTWELTPAQTALLAILMEAPAEHDGWVTSDALVGTTREGKVGAMYTAISRLNDVLDTGTPTCNHEGVAIENRTGRYRFAWLHGAKDNKMSELR